MPPQWIHMLALHPKQSSGMNFNDISILCINIKLLHTLYIHPLPEFPNAVVVECCKFAISNIPHVENIFHTHWFMRISKTQAISPKWGKKCGLLHKQNEIIYDGKSKLVIYIPITHSPWWTIYIFRFYSVQFLFALFERKHFEDFFLYRCFRNQLMVKNVYSWKFCFYFPFFFEQNYVTMPVLYWLCARLFYIYIIFIPKDRFSFLQTTNHIISFSLPHVRTSLQGQKKNRYI